MSRHGAHRELDRMFYLKTPNMDYAMEMGEISFGKFYSYGGITMLKNLLTICEKDSKLLSQIQIKDDQNVSYNPEEFLDTLTGLEIVDNG
tara:strand:+ start:489 stop:758 length:270 start_codon:yes stop_codon:yes gene_type:complete